MNKENVQKWVDALRSGEYRKARGKFFGSHGEACAIGVGIIAMQRDTGLPCISSSTGTIQDFKEWAGGIPLLKVDDDDDTVSIPYANDILDLPLTEIGDLIQKSYL